LNDILIAFEKSLNDKLRDILNFLINIEILFLKSLLKFFIIVYIQIHLKLWNSLKNLLNKRWIRSAFTMENLLKYIFIILFAIFEVLVFKNSPFLISVIKSILASGAISIIIMWVIKKFKS
jgi:hypothetical protein